MSKLHELNKVGQSIWLDDIRRAYFSTGELTRLVALGVRGLTSNPTIFEKAIAGSADYDVKLRELVRQGKSVSEIYEALAIERYPRGGRCAAPGLRPERRHRWFREPGGQPEAGA